MAVKIAVAITITEAALAAVTVLTAMLGPERISQRAFRILMPGNGERIKPAAGILKVTADA